VRAGDANIARIAAALAPLGVAIEISESAPELVALARSGAVDAVVLDADLTEAWPTDAAMRIAVDLADRVPLLVICTAAHDASVISQRLAGVEATVLARDGITEERLRALLEGMLATSVARTT
jgi:hypothetical protein